uniref:MADS-box protein SOC1-like n=1 Tax=Nicotiana tabacum TaxID=4097 RepID=A0A1S4CG11_TOBAC|nr:PREDICTED: MADS-box protein SOC1-like [Nicotiana tabacum]
MYSFCDNNNGSSYIWQTEGKECSSMAKQDKQFFFFSPRGNFPHVFSSCYYIVIDFDLQHLKEETANIAKKIEILEVSKRKLMGQGIGSCSMNELQEIDSQLEKSLKNIRARKTQLLKDEIERLKAKEKQLLEENERLSEECGLRRKPEAPPPPLTRISQQKETASCSHSVQNTEVETDLFIGLPDICWS